MARIAVVGTGIAGLSAAFMLNARHEITVYEKDQRIGGHSRTVTVNYDGVPLTVDTGFIVFNKRNYPNLTALFDLLGVTIKGSDMSFGFTANGGRFEWGAKTLNAVFGQRSNLFRPSFIKLFLDVLRFNATVEKAVESHPDATLGELLMAMKLGDEFRWSYLLPMAGAIWSCPPRQILEFPARIFVRFFANHNLLSLTGQPQWMTVVGGSQSYVEKLSAPFRDRIRKGCAASKVGRDHGEVRITDTHGNVERFDEVIFACHPDETLAALTDATDAERKALGSITYQHNLAVLHRDQSFMPLRRACWASWIYQSDHQGDTDKRAVTYWMNSLQGIDESRPIFVTLNPHRPISPSLVFDRHVFMHPIFDFEALAAQDALKSMQGERNTWFCGAYMGHGFHEDGLVSAVIVAEALGAPVPWSNMIGAESRIRVAATEPARLSEDRVSTVLG